MGDVTAPGTGATAAGVPHEPLARLFLRFLRFGLLAWGGPVAQIAMIRQELVEEERWISREQFNRALAVYQVLPGPEAHELCVYFGMLSRGRVGALLAGLGFMLPGFLLMLGLSWAYVRFGLELPAAAAAFLAVQAAVSGLIVRAIQRIGAHALLDRWLWAIAIACGLAQLAAVPFWLPLAGAGAAYALVRGGRSRSAAGVLAAILLAAAYWAWRVPAEALVPLAGGAAGAPRSISVAGLFASGLRAGLLTFGGAYTAIPFVRRDAVVDGGWMTDGQFLDGLALGGVLPAPLIIFGTFVGYVGAGLGGAVVMTLGIFVPAFLFTMVGHDFFERVIHRPGVAHVLDGVTAGVVGLIAATTLLLVRGSVRDLFTAAVFILTVAVLFATKSRLAIPGVILASAIAGILLRAVSGS